jgi:hypothetical protein
MSRKKGEGGSKDAEKTEDNGVVSLHRKWRGRKVGNEEHEEKGVTLAKKRRHLLFTTDRKGRDRYTCSGNLGV